MKKSLQLLCFLMLSTTFLVSCSQEEPLPFDESSEVNFKASSRDSDLIMITVQFYPHVTEAEKADRRKEYESSGVLKSWVKCEDDPEEKEVWTIFCPGCHGRDSDVPVKTDPCSDGEERASARASDRCEVRRVQIGNWCIF